MSGVFVTNRTILKIFSVSTFCQGIGTSITAATAERITVFSQTSIKKITILLKSRGEPCTHQRKKINPFAVERVAGYYTQSKTLTNACPSVEVGLEHAVERSNKMNHPSVKTPTAKKYHSCDCCDYRIVPNTKYFAMKFFGEQIGAVKLCSSCKEIYDFWHVNCIDLYVDVDDLLFNMQADWRNQNAVLNDDDERGCALYHERKDKEMENGL
jgi:hypothetical protein